MPHRQPIATAFLAASLLLWPALATGQRPMPPRPSNDVIGRHLFPPELVMRFQTDIGLSDDQQKSLRTEIGQAQMRFTELQWDLQAAAQQLTGLLADDRINEQQVLEKLDHVLDAERKIKKAQITLMVRIKNTLTGEQQARLEELRPAGRR